MKPMIKSRLENLVDENFSAEGSDSLIDIMEQAIEMLLDLGWQPELLHIDLRIDVQRPEEDEEC